MDVKQYETGKIVHVQSIMHEIKRNVLRHLTGENATKDAITKAIDYYIENNHKRNKLWKKKIK